MDKCKHCVVAGETWQSIADLYVTDWLQLWAANANTAQAVPLVYGASLFDGTCRSPLPFLFQLQRFSSRSTCHSNIESDARNQVCILKGLVFKIWWRAFFKQASIVRAWGECNDLHHARTVWL